MRPDGARRRRCPAIALLLGAVVLASCGLFAGGPGRAGATPGKQPAEVSLLESSAWVGVGRTFSLRLGLPTGLAASDRIVVTAYSRLNSRSYFDQAVNGQTGEAVWLGSETVGGAPHAGKGGIWARIPVEGDDVAGDLLGGAFDPGPQSGVYPLRVQVIGANYEPIGGSLSTFLVYSANQAGFDRLAVSVTVPVTAAPTLSSKLLPTPVTAAQSSALSALGSLLSANRTVALNLAISPQILEALRAGDRADHMMLTRLRRLARGGDEVLPEPYVPVSLSGLDAAGLDQPGPADLLADQLGKGAAVLDAELGTTIGMGTWVFDGGTTGNLDDATVQRLHELGLRNVIVPDAAVTGLPAALTTTTYARPAVLDDGGDPGLEVMATDPILQGRMTPSTDPVLAANRTLAELAMIELETPGVARGIALTLPADDTPPGPYLSTLLAGLRGNPFVRTVTASKLFTSITDHVPTSEPLTSGGAHQAIPVRSLRPLPVLPVDGAAGLQSLDARIGGLATFLPADGALVAQLRRQLLVAPASGLSPSTRHTLLTSMQDQIDRATSSVQLPGDISVTLTSLKSTLPLTVLSGSNIAPHVLLTLDSPKLGFRTYDPPDGSCTESSRTSEVCNLVLHGPEETLRIPVEARTSGVFALDVSLTSPDGSITLATARDTVRSTAVSSVGLVIIVGTLVLLGFWWIRDIRSGRRARRLVRRTADDIDDEDGGPPDGGVDTEPPERPVGPSEPVSPPGVVVPAEPASPGPAAVLAEPASPGPAAVLAEPASPGPATVHVGAGGLRGPVDRGRHLAPRRRHRPVGMRRMSPSHPPAGPTRRVDPPEEPAP